MPEGPSIIILKEKLQEFTGRKVVAVGGNTKVDVSRAEGQKIIHIKSWGKHLLICFKGFTIRIHLMLFGSYRINEDRKSEPRLHLGFADGEINFYACSVKLLEGNINKHYDWAADVMNDKWSAAKAKVKLKEVPEMLACDALLEQEIFSGVGNIIKNEVLYRVHIQPEAKVGNIPPKKISEMIKEARQYAFDFLEWKNEGTLKKHWLAHTKKKCKRCNLPMIKKITGKKKRRSFFCTNCQHLYE